MIPGIALALIGISRGIASRDQAAKARPAPAPVPASVERAVVRSAKDARFTYVLLEREGAFTWVATREAPPPVSQLARYEISTAIDAYESKELGMAFDRVLFASESS